MTRLRNGGYLWVRGINGAIAAVAFDSNLQFVSEAQFATAAAETIAIADVNGDGNPDILTGTAFPHSAGLQVLLGSGGSSFQPPATYDISSSLFVSSMAIADVNGDGKPDAILASSSPSAGKISVFLGNGDGTFQPERVAVSGPEIPAVAVGDLNGDKRPDLVYTERTDIDFGYGPALAVIYGAGDGSFGGPIKYGCAWSDSVAIGDVDGDGAPDVVTSGVTIWFNDGRGRLARRFDYWQQVTGALLLGDFNGDNKTDIVTGTGTLDALLGPAVAVIYGAGGATFGAPPVSLATGLPDANNGVYGLAMGDLNGDGVPDLAVMELQRISILIGKGDGTFREAYLYTPTGGVPTAIAIADVNRDSNPDVVITIDSETGGRIEVLPGRGDGTLVAPIATPTPRGPFSLTVTDLNGDGSPDAVVLLNAAQAASQDRMLVYLGNGRGGFASPISTTTGVRPSAIAVGDFNADKRQDIVVAATGDASTDGGLILLVGKGDGTFAAPAPIGGITSASAVTAADLDRDGKLDLAVVSGQKLVIVPGNNDGTFRSGGSFSVSDGFKPTIADLNGDGIPDVINGSRASWLIGNGDGTFQPEVAFAPNAYPLLTDPVVADFNRDGKPDFAGGLFTTGVATVFGLSQPVPLTVVNGASFAAGPIAPDSLVTAFGTNFGPNATVTVGTASARILYSSSTQINFLVPASTPLGSSTVRVGSVSVPATLAAVSPAIFPGAYLLIRVRGDQQTVETVTGPIDLGPEGDQVYLSLYGTGIRGAPQNRVTVRVQGLDVPVLFAGAQPDFVGLDQVNILLPRSLAGTGEANLIVTASGVDSPTVKLLIK
jgi:uncharacterized protein (TIGR03437 family)